MLTRLPSNLRLRFPPTSLLLLGPLLFATPVWAEILVSEDDHLDASSTPDSYRVIGPATLTAVGASTQQITALPGASLDLSNSTITAQPNAVGLSLRGAEATAQGIRVSSDARGLGLSGESTAVFSGASVIEGGVQGATINTSTVTLQGSTLRGTGESSEGARLIASTLTAAQGSTISGSSYGVRVLEDNGRGSTLIVDDSTIEGRNGPAIAVGRGAGFAASAQVDVLNGGNLSSANGVLLDVAEDASANLRVNASALSGDVVVASGGIANVALENAATLTGRLENVARLDVDSGAEWVLVQDSQVGHLDLAEGAVRFGGLEDFYTLSVENLTGNGTFIMQADFATAQSDLLDVTGTASGTHLLSMTASGIDPSVENSLQVVRTASGDAQFSLAGGPVDLGAYSYDLVQRDSNDWYLDVTTRTVSPGAQSVMALASAAPTLWYGELGVLRSRMGEVRRQPRAAGSWVRAYGNQYNVSASSDTPYQQHQQGLSIGVDTPLAAGDGNWLIGVTAGYSDSDLSLKRGTTASVDSYHAGLYATWLDADSGYYFDAVARLNHLENEADVRLSDGSKTQGEYSALAAGASLEIGRQLTFTDGWFLEPFAQLSGLVVQGKDYRLDNGMRAESDRTRSLQGKVGTTLGRTFTAGEGRSVQPYLRVAAVHEFVDDNSVRVNDNRFTTDLSGSRGEVGVGMAVAWGERWQGHADFDYAHGDKLEQPWGVNLGVRYNW